MIAEVKVVALNVADVITTSGYTCDDEGTEF